MKKIILLLLIPISSAAQNYGWNEILAVKIAKMSLRYTMPEALECKKRITRQIVPGVKWPDHSDMFSIHYAPDTLSDSLFVKSFFIQGGKKRMNVYFYFYSLKNILISDIDMLLSNGKKLHFKSEDKELSKLPTNDRIHNLYRFNIHLKEKYIQQLIDNQIKSLYLLNYEFKLTDEQATKISKMFICMSNVM